LNARPSFRRFIQILDAFVTDLPATGATPGNDASAPGSLPAVPGQSRSPSPGIVSSTDRGGTEIPRMEIGQEFITPVGQRRLQILKLAGAGSRAKVYQALAPDERQTYALKIIHEHTPVHLQSIVVETVKTATLAAHQLPYARIIEIGVTYVLKEWIDGLAGDGWVRRWLEQGAAPDDTAFQALIRFFRMASARGVHVGDLKPENMMLRGAADWVVIDCGPIDAPVPPAAAMKCYRERFIRRWLWASRSPFWYLVYQIWRRVRRVDRHLPKVQPGISPRAYR
jgi:hypothetical protein